MTDLKVSIASHSRILLTAVESAIAKAALRVEEHLLAHLIARSEERKTETVMKQIKNR